MEQKQGVLQLLFGQFCLKGKDAFVLSKYEIYPPYTSAYDNFFLSLNNFRQLVKHIFQTYLPTFIIVFVSWLSFLVPPAAYPGRMGMLVVLILVIINILLKVVEMSPRPSGICGLTLWTIICLITVSQYVSMKFLIESIY